MGTDYLFSALLSAFIDIVDVALRRSRSTRNVEYVKMSSIGDETIVRPQLREFLDVKF